MLLRMKKIQAQTVIRASPERVWAVLTDFASYSAWNPFIKAISGELRTGAQLAVRIAPSGGSGMSFKPLITELSQTAVLEWLGHLIVPGLFDGRHRFELTPLPDGTTSFSQSETFSGITIPLFASVLKDTERGF